MAAGLDNTNSTTYIKPTNNWASDTDSDDTVYVYYSVGDRDEEYDPRVPITRCRYCPHCKIFFNRKNRYCPKCCYDSFSKLERLLAYLASKDSHSCICRVYEKRAAPIKTVKKRDREGKQLFELLKLEAINENQKCRI